MRQHLGAMVWHALEAISEAPRADDVSSLVLEFPHVELKELGIDDGYVSEAADRDTHILPEEVRQGKPGKNAT